MRSLFPAWRGGAHDIRRINHVKVKVAMTAEDMIKYRVTR